MSFVTHPKETTIDMEMIWMTKYIWKVGNVCAGIWVLSFCLGTYIFQMTLRFIL